MNVDKEEAIKRLAIMKAKLPDVEKEVSDSLRLVELARKSPFAGVNADFLDRIEAKWNSRKAENSLMRQLIEVMDEVDL